MNELRPDFSVMALSMNSEHQDQLKALRSDGAALKEALLAPSISFQ